MNRIERKLLYRTSALGLLLTATVIAADAAGWLTGLERWLWDRRARWCQHFTPPPTDRIVHLMIDDDSLQTIGAWPWPRVLLARVIDELTAADAKVIALDMFFPERQQPTPQIDNDQALSASIRRSGRVLLPNSVEFRETIEADPMVSASLEEFEANAELTDDELRDRLARRNFDRRLVDREMGRLSVEPRRLAMLRRIIKELPSATQPAALRAKIIPKADASGVTSDAAYLFEPTLDQARAVLLLRRFGKQPVPTNVPLLRADGERAVSITTLLSEAAASGFVDVLPAEDGAVRSLPLCINYRGMVWPTMAFTLACMELGVNPIDCRIERDAVIIPAADGDRIVPTRVDTSRHFGEVGAIFDIPWFGSTAWLEMYRRADPLKLSQFLPIKAVWTIGQLELDIQRNNDTTDDALLALAKPYQVETALQFLALPGAERNAVDRAAAVAAVVAIAIDDPAAAESLKMLGDADPATLSDEDRKFLSAATVLRRGDTANAALRSLVAERRQQFKSIVAGKIVMVGWSATGKLDFFPTSIHSACPGSVIQGAVFNAIVTGHMLRAPPRWIAGLFTMVIGLLCTAAVAKFSPWKAFAAAGALATAYALVNGYVLYDWGNQIVGAAAPIVGAGATWSLLTLSKYINETRERSRITRRFRSYVDPALVDFVIEHPERMSLEGEVREVTVAFTDLAGFTSIAESLQERAVPILNQYMGLMVPIIRKHQGLVNKFLGDGIMFFYGAPREHPHKARAAVQTVLEMNEALGPLNQQLGEKNLPLVNMRAGIATGNVVVGDAGAIEGEHQASDYTVLGDRVNLAARLEAANKAFGTAVLIEQRTYDLIRDEFAIRPIGRVKVKGKDEGVSLYEPICAIDLVTDELRAELDAYCDLVEQYQRGDFDRCAAAAKAITSRFGDKKMLALYQSLCAHFSLPEHRSAFSGDIVLTEK